jgi:hypothetical protein
MANLAILAGQPDSQSSGLADGLFSRFSGSANRWNSQTSTSANPGSIKRDSGFALLAQLATSSRRRREKHRRFFSQPITDVASPDSE